MIDQKVKGVVIRLTGMIPRLDNFETFTEDILKYYSEIAVIGANNVKRSTLAKALAEYSGRPLIPEITGKLISETGFDQKYGDSAQIFEGAVMYTHPLYLKCFRNDLKRFISDGSLVDVLAYSTYYFLRDKISADFVKGVQDVLMENRKHYDLFIHITPRSEDEPLAIMIDMQISQILQGR